MLELPSSILNRFLGRTGEEGHKSLCSLQCLQHVYAVALRGRCVLQQPCNRCSHSVLNLFSIMFCKRAWILLLQKPVFHIVENKDHICSHKPRVHFVLLEEHQCNEILIQVNVVFHLCVFKHSLEFSPSENFYLSWFQENNFLVLAD